MKDMKPFIIEIVFGIILIGVSFFVKNDTIRLWFFLWDLVL